MSTPYPDSVRYLYALGNEQKIIKLGLERIRAVLEELGRPHDSFRAIHVAGTNGKGSTCAMIESALRRFGVRTGLFVSPHLVQPTERISVGGVPAGEEEFTAAFERVHSACERLVSTGAIDMHTTYFETLTAMGFLIFHERQVDTAVVEVGMGGRLDATNVLSPVLSVITPVDFDHEKHLGATIPEIASEKAGIIKPGRPVVVAAQRTEAFETIAGKAGRENAPLLDARAWAIERHDLHALGALVRYTRTRPIEIELNLIGAHQIDNAQTALAALETLGVPAAAIQDGLRDARWPGRLEFVRRRPDLLLDGAHNPAGARALAGYLRRFHGGRRIWMIFAAMHDKDLRALGELLFPLASHLIFTAPDNPRSYSPEEIKLISGRAEARCCPTAAAALQSTAAEPGDLVLVTGSLYLVGEVRGLLGL